MFQLSLELYRKIHTENQSKYNFVNILAPLCFTCAALHPLFTIFIMQMQPDSCADDRETPNKNHVLNKLNIFRAIFADSMWIWRYFEILASKLISWWKLNIFIAKVFRVSKDRSYFWPPCNLVGFLILSLEYRLKARYLRMWGI